MIPKHIRKLLKLSEGDKLSIVVDQGGVVLKPMAKKEPAGWRSWEGLLENTHALEDHAAEHAEEVER